MNMKRKLVKQGKQALTITIPSSWVKQHHLKPHDEVDLEESKGALCIRTQARLPTKCIEIQLQSNNDTYISAIFRNLYINGYDEIKIALAEKTIIAISRAIDPLIGYEIIEQDKSSCTVKDISLGTNTEYENLIRKLFYTVFEMQDVISRTFIQRKREDDAMIEELSNQASKFACFSRRILFKSDFYKDEKGLAKYMIINFIHMIARDYQWMYEHVINHTKKTASTTRQFHSKVAAYLHDMFDAYCKQDIEKVNVLLDNRGSIKEQGFSCMTRDSPIIAYLLEIVRLCGTMGGKIGFIATLPDR